VIKEFAEQQGYALDHSYIEAYAGAGNVVQKLTAAVQAGDAPDLITHTLQASELKFLEIIEDVDTLQKDIIKEFGKTVPGLEGRDLIDGKYWAVGHFLRSGSYWAVEKYFKDVGVDIRKDLGTYDDVREACLKAANPEKEIYGYGITANRSGDGETAVRDAVIMFGGQLVDESGQLVVLNKDPFREYGVAGLTWLKDIYTDPKWARAIPPGVQSWTDPSNNEAYLAGKLAFTGNAGTMFAKAVFDKNPIADETWLIPRPKGNGPGGRTLEGADGMRWFVMKGAKNREAAEQLIKHMLTPDVQREIFKISTGYAYPAYEWGWEEKFMTEDKYAQHVTPAFKQAAWDPAGYIGGAWPGPPSPQVAALESSNFWTDTFGEVLGGKAPADALKAAHDRAVRVFKEFGAKGE
jgi:multiple sugar transport system substrate-binding protein